MTELEEINSKLDNMLAREDTFEERHKQSVEENKTYMWITAIFVVSIILFLGLGYYAGYEAALTEITRKAILTKLGVVV